MPTRESAKHGYVNILSGLIPLAEVEAGEFLHDQVTNTVFSLGRRIVIEISWHSRKDGNDDKDD